MSDSQARVGRYAQAILQTMVERWEEALGQVQSAIVGDPTLVGVLSDMSKDAASKLSAVEKALPATLPAEVRNFVRLLIQEGDFSLLPQVSAALVQTVSGRSGPTKAEITSAVELSITEQADMRRMLTQQHGEGMVFSFRVDPSLMGGLRVRIGDTLIDTSVASRLARLRESLAAVVR